MKNVMDKSSGIGQYVGPVNVQKHERVRVPLRMVILIPFILQIIIISGLVGYISYYNGQKAVNEVAGQLHSEINARINEYLKSFLETPWQIIQNNASAVSHGLLDYQNQQDIEHYFWEQIHIYRYVSSIYFGNASGGIADSGREAITGTAYILATDGFRSGILRKYSTNIEGKRGGQLQVIPGFDARTRPWFKTALLKEDAAWSDIYILFTGQDMAISASKPVYDNSRRLLGVVSVDLFLSQISGFLSGIDIGKTGVSFIIDHDGLFIASSTNEMIISPKKAGESQRRLSAGESTSPVIRSASERLIREYGSFSRIKSSKHLEFTVNGEKKFMQVSPAQNQHGLDWIIVSVVPESDFMDKINSNNRATVALIFFSILLSLFIGYLTSFWIAEPVSLLDLSAGAMSGGRWPDAPGRSRIVEIDELNMSFFKMSGQLKDLIGDLTLEIKERKLTEDALRESEEKYRELIQYSNSIIIRIDNKGRILYANDYALNFFGFSSEELFGNNVVGTIVPYIDKSGRNLDDMVNTIISNPEHFERNENENIRKDGTRVWIVWSNRVVNDEHGLCAEILCIGTDITERRLAEIEIKKLLTEKEILLHEVHHRIKNNMNTVAGLLYLQSESIDNEPAAAALKDAHNRVLSMMIIYDKLFRSSDFSSISTEGYLQDLISGITSTLPDFRHVSIKTGIENCILESGTLVPVGIIINELLTNAHKYAFPEKRNGVIEIYFKKTGDKSFELVFKDDGAGMPEPVAAGESKGFGLNLVYLITQQMQGTVEIIRDKGSVFIIKFSV